MKNMLLLGMVIMMVLTSCNSDDEQLVDTSVVSQQVTNRVPETMFGNYKHHLGEEVTGTIEITKDYININTSDVKYNIDVHSNEIVLKPWCQDKILDITFYQCKKKVILRISNWVGQSEHTNYITLSKDYNVVGNFDIIKPVQMN